MRALVEKVLSGVDLTEHDARALLDHLTDPGLDSVLAAAALAGLRAKGETPDEVRAFALGLREIAIRPDIPAGVPAVDIVGTGGDGSGSLNLSTGSALVAAAAGVPVVKHGNRSISSRSGSADVLAALGMSIPWDANEAARVFEDTGFTFLFAPTYHPAMKSIAPVRRALGIRTIFNLVGPLANPATPPFAVIGAYSLGAARMLATTLSAMPIERAFVVNGESGWDEPTPMGPYHLFDVTPGSVISSVEDPADFGLRRCLPRDLAGGDPAFNAAALRRVLEGEDGPHRDALVLGASLALRVTGRDQDPLRALASASAGIDDGRALDLLARLGGTNHV
ncbi:MAG: anthranilate phosphoribosyltransferase [Gammaproteobacteria bacterium]|nr:anthranilate phosphoribosyltransferase [Gammaproteobacteria bacterium]